jgi:hypothetical protein
MSLHQCQGVTIQQELLSVTIVTWTIYSEVNSGCLRSCTKS